MVKIWNWCRRWHSYNETMITDKPTLQRVQLLHPKIRKEVIDTILKVQDAGVNIRIVQGLRTFAEQDALYAQGRTKPGAKVTNAKGGYSYHNFGIAMDFCLLHKDGSISWDLKEDLDGDKVSDWTEVIKIFEMAGFESGIHWKFRDAPHLQKTFGLTITQCLDKIAKKRVDAEGYILI